LDKKSNAFMTIHLLVNVEILGNSGDGRSWLVTIADLNGFNQVSDSDEADKKDKQRSILTGTLPAVFCGEPTEEPGGIK